MIRVKVGDLLFVNSEAHFLLRFQQDLLEARLLKMKSRSMWSSYFDISKVNSERAE
jgi:hypothetical protein